MTGFGELLFESVEAPTKHALLAANDGCNALLGGGFGSTASFFGLTGFLGTASFFRKAGGFLTLTLGFFCEPTFFRETGFFSLAAFLVKLGLNAGARLFDGLAERFFLLLLELGFGSPVGFDALLNFLYGRKGNL